MNSHLSHNSVDKLDDTPVKSPSQPPPKADVKTPHALIVGAGLGGLLLAILLDKAGISYEIYERAPIVKPLGSIMTLSVNVLPAMEQLELYEEMKAISVPQGGAKLMYEDLKLAIELPAGNTNNVFGYDMLLFCRPKLQELLLSKISPEKIHYNKKVLSAMQDKDGVTIRCADGSTHNGDILCGADGAYSSIRKDLYRTLKDKRTLPPSDSKELSKGYLCLVGTTDPLDPEKYPVVKNETGIFTHIIGRGTQYTWSELNISENRVCWVVVYQFTSLEESERMMFHNPEWAPQTNDEFISQVRHFKVPGCGTVGNLIDLTPADGISRVFLEDKLFETWNYGRTVLIGDAAHKLLPSAGQGAVCAMQDAIILANCLYDMKSLSQNHIEAALNDYKEQRYGPVKTQFDQSKLNAMILNGQTLFDRCFRYIAVNWVPESMQMKNFAKAAEYRPQVSFLPLTPKKGTAPVLPQKPSKRYERERTMKKETPKEQTLTKQEPSETTIAAAI